VGVHPTPERAASAFATDLSAEGKQASTEAEIVDISSSSAVRGDVSLGSTIAVLGVNEDEAGWAVETFISC
jgi:hypothetical protein